MALACPSYFLVNYFLEQFQIQGSAEHCSPLHTCTRTQTLLPLPYMGNLYHSGSHICCTCSDYSHTSLPPRVHKLPQSSPLLAFHKCKPCSVQDRFTAFKILSTLPVLPSFHLNPWQLICFFFFNNQSFYYLCGFDFSRVSYSQK